MNRNNRKTLPPLDTTSIRKPIVETQRSAIVDLGGAGDHINRLKQVSTTAESLFRLLGDQVQVLSATVPVLRGFDLVNELRETLGERREGLDDALKPLRDHVEREKERFYLRHADAIQEKIRKRVEEGVKQRLPVIVKERLKRYRDYLKTNGALTGDIKLAVDAMSARTANSTLCPNHPNEPIALIPPHPEWDRLTLGSLKSIDGPAAAKLAKDQGLPPVEGSVNPELARVRNLNRVLRHIGANYQGIPSRNGLLLASITSLRSL